ncbi:MAG: hypothetical protein IPP63_11810 [Chloracidobacterium sp.]|nr:hypothetical protein [Chloracidobacterium sp.]MBK9767640.1 hypothetical protein [Chloracidobacterium sp.]MBL0240889.1 hypothetical protein [Chloracidobacterium sp.]
MAPVSGDEVVGGSHERELKRLRTRSSRAAMVDGILDGSYGRNYAANDPLLTVHHSPFT